MNRKRIISLASTAMYAAIAQDWPKANKATQAIGDEFGGDGVIAAALAWCDSMLAHTPGVDPTSGNPVRLTFKNLESGRVDNDANQVPPAIRWAGRIVAARAADDEPGFRGLIESLESDKQFSEYIGALLSMVAANLRPVADAARQVRASRETPGDGQVPA
ncbi:MAG: hypothetical protein JWO11_4117 [Nocardioides sp.]|nr:hypothetical protein [Nocardioides sp.]